MLMVWQIDFSSHVVLGENVSRCYFDHVVQIPRYPESLAVGTQKELNNKVPIRSN